MSLVNEALRKVQTQSSTTPAPGAANARPLPEPLQHLRDDYRGRGRQGTLLAMLGGGLAAAIMLTLVGGFWFVLLKGSPAPSVAGPVALVNTPNLTIGKQAGTVPPAQVATPELAVEVAPPVPVTGHAVAPLIPSPVEPAIAPVADPASVECEPVPVPAASSPLVHTPEAGTRLAQALAARESASLVAAPPAEPAASALPAAPTPALPPARANDAGTGSLVLAMGSAEIALPDSTGPTTMPAQTPGGSGVASPSDASAASGPEPLVAGRTYVKTLAVLGLPVIELGGIAYAPGRAIALINGTTAEVGEDLGQGIMLLDIERKRLKLAAQGKEFYLRLP